MEYITVIQHQVPIVTKTTTIMVGEVLMEYIIVIHRQVPIVTKTGMVALMEHIEVIRRQMRMAIIMPLMQYIIVITKTIVVAVHTMFMESTLITQELTISITTMTNPM